MKLKKLIEELVDCALASREDDPEVYLQSEGTGQLVYDPYQLDIHEHTGSIVIRFGEVAQ